LLKNYTISHINFDDKNMKKSLKYLPENKQEELQKIVAAIQKSCKDVEKIILFGSYARGDYKEKKDLKPLIIPKSRITSAPLLKGIIRCGVCGAKMVPTYTKKQGKRYRYYL